MVRWYYSDAMVDIEEFLSCSGLLRPLGEIELHTSPHPHPLNSAGARGQHRHNARQGG